MSSKPGQSCPGSMSFAVVLPANLQAWLASVGELLMNGGYGARPYGSLENFVRRASYSKIQLDLLPSTAAEPSRKSFTPLPPMGMTSAGSVCLLPTWVRLTGESESSSSAWPTPDANLFNDGQTMEAWSARHDRERLKGYNGNGGGTPLAMAVQFWPTPNRQDAAISGENYTEQDHAERERLKKSNNPNLGGLQKHLANVVNWPTPNLADSRVETSTRTQEQHEAIEAAAKASNPNLGGLQKRLSDVVNWATPTALDSSSTGNRNKPGSKANPGVSLTDQTERGISYETIRKGIPGTTPTTRLNPAWVTQLMGFPDGWLDVGPPDKAKPKRTGKLRERAKSSKDEPTS